ncbi:MAG: cytochrome c-type biosis protein CcmH [Acidobacteriota bacterium]|jgi:tetratricopeptide (TPR) repeat protein|nr:cytochrome c-type biosis protein CcmH [Acidobacteriota bacterium]
MSNATDWTPALAVLGSGLIIGIAVVFVMKFRRTTTPEPSTPFFARHPVAKGYLWGIISAAAIGMLTYYGSLYSAPRAPAPVVATAPQAEPELAQLQEAVKADPENMEHHIALAKANFSRDDLMGVYNETNIVLAKQPDEPRALTYNAVVRMAMGKNDEARTMLERATKADPNLIDAWVALASIRSQAGDKAGATAAIDSAIAQRPEDEARLREVFAKMQLPPEVRTGKVAHPPIASEKAGAPIRITLAVEDGASVKSGIVYIIARADGQAAGHPVAVKRIRTNSFPVDIEIGASDAMMGQPFPSLLHVEARLDSDGDAGTREPSDPKAAADRVAAGAALTLTLK